MLSCKGQITRTVTMKSIIQLNYKNNDWITLVLDTVSDGNVILQRICYTNFGQRIFFTKIAMIMC